MQGYYVPGPVPKVYQGKEATPCPSGAYILVVGAVMVVRERLDLGIYFL